ncbi:TolC family protein [Acidicapsa acidisoli]|uniref:TolC family protein n=1 Tax=Acidicapsa acidisoli TaxID=1615681 RepID=UPI0021E0271C|nr:TolC family protein [Acidicapsa acidisoli]
MSIWTTVSLLLLLLTGDVFAQSAPASPGQPAHFAGEREIEDSAKQFVGFRFSIQQDQTYTLAELVNLAEEHNPATRVAWQTARAQMAALGVARSELYPTVAAVALSQTNRSEVLFGSQFDRQTVQSFSGALDLNYTIFDFGGRAGRITAARSDLLAANFAFNDTHRKIINEVTEAYDRLLNAAGQVEAARASLRNAQTVQQAAEDRLNNGLATLPDVLEARSAAAQAQYDLQAALGIEKNTRGDLAAALGTRPTDAIRVQPIDQLTIPEALDDSVGQAMDRAFEQRPDLMQHVAEVRKANAGVKEARAAYYPAFSITATPSAQSLYGLQQQLPWAHTADLHGELQLRLNWTLFDGGKRKNNLAQAQAKLRAAEAGVNVTRDNIADEVWKAYSNLETALGQRQAAAALLSAADQSYSAVLESYNDGVRNLLDVTAAQATLANARSADVLARAQVLTSLADLVFETGDSLQSSARSPKP